MIEHYHMSIWKYIDQLLFHFMPKLSDTVIVIYMYDPLLSTRAG